MVEKEIKELNSDELKQLIKQFIKQSFTENQTFKQYKGKYRNLDIKVGFGHGNKADITWFAFLGEGHEVQNGIYPVLLFDWKNNKLYISYGVSAKEKTKLSWGSYTIDKNNVPIDKYKNSYLEELMEGVDENILDDKLDEIIESLDKVIDVYLEVLGIEENNDKKEETYKFKDINPTIKIELEENPSLTGNKKELIIEFLKENELKKFTTKQLYENLQEAYPYIFDKEADINFRNILRSLEEKGIINKETFGKETLRWYNKNYIIFKDGSKKKVLPLDINLENIVKYSKNAQVRGFLKYLLDILLDNCGYSSNKIDLKLKETPKTFKNIVDNYKTIYKSIEISFRYDPKGLYKELKIFLKKFKPCLSKYISKIVYDGEVIFGDKESKIGLINQNEQEENNNQENLNQEQIDKEVDNTIKNENTTSSQSNPKNQKETKTFAEIMTKYYKKEDNKKDK